MNMHERSWPFNDCTRFGLTNFSDLTNKLCLLRFLCLYLFLWLNFFLCLSLFLYLYLFLCHGIFPPLLYGTHICVPYSVRYLYQLFLRMPTVTWEPTPAWETHRACLLLLGICKLCQSLGFSFPHFFQILGSP